MDELFTFNSRQLQNITNRPPPSSSPKYRKRILSSKLSKKLNKLSQIVSEDQISQTDRHPVKSSSKKVTFKVTSPSVCLRKGEVIPKEIPRQPKSVIIIRKKDRTTEKIQETGSFIPRKQSSETIVRSLAKRVFSAVERNDRKQKIKIEHSTCSQKNQEQTILRREKRVNSVKASPKVLIPSNIRKLPQVFRLKFGEKKSSRENGIVSKFISEDIFSQKCKKQAFDYSPPVNLMGLEKWKNLYHLEDKVFAQLSPF